MAKPQSSSTLRMSMAALLPNAITLGSLCCGLTSIRYAFDAQWSVAIILLMVAAIMDGLDGPTARLLKVQSELGAQLDSLADFINFGVAPSFIIFLWGLQSLPLAGWGVALCFASCCAIRLARFNSDLHCEDEKPPYADCFFVGTPAPASALLVLLPLVANFVFPHWQFSTHMMVLYMALIAWLMVSRFPTPSIKNLRIARRHAVLALIAIIFVALGLWFCTWLTYLIVASLYGVSIVVSVMFYYRKTKRFIL